MPTARRARQDLIAVPATAGDHAGDLTDGQHAPNDYAPVSAGYWDRRRAFRSTGSGRPKQ
jgi:hypothetical protein